MWKNCAELYELKTIMTPRSLRDRGSTPGDLAENAEYAVAKAQALSRAHCGSRDQTFNAQPIDPALIDADGGRIRRHGELEDMNNGEIVIYRSSVT